MSWTRGITYGFKQVIAADSRQYPLAAGKANGYTCAVGPEPGVGYVLMLLSDLTALSTATGHELVMYCSGDSGVPATRLSFRNLYVVKATRVTGGYSGDPNALMLVELTDRRYHLNRWTSVNRQFNVPAPCEESAYLTESKNGGSAWTWTTLIGQLWTDAGLGTAPSLPLSMPSTAPTNLKFVGVNAWQALHQVLDKVKLTTAYDPVADSFSIIAVNETVSTAVANQAEYYGNPVSGIACRGPATIRVFFPYVEEDTGQENDTGTSSNWTSTPAYSVDVATGLTGAVSGSVQPLWDDLPALIEHGESALTGSMTTALSTRANERASAWLETYAKNNALRESLIYTGLVNKRPSGKFKQIIWRDYGAEYGGLVTELCRYPGVPGEMPDSGLDDGNFTPPPHDPSVWPERAQPVKLVSATKADSSHDLYDGKVCRYISTATGGGFTDYEDCYIYFLESSPSVSANDRFIGRLCGLVTSNSAVTRPLYLVRAGGAGGSSAKNWTIIWFTVDSDFTTSASDFTVTVTRVIGTTGIVAVSDTGVVVLNQPAQNEPYMFSGNTGDAGQAYYDPDEEEWICFLLECTPA